MTCTALHLARKDILSDLRTLRSPVVSMVFSLSVMAAFRFAFADYGEFEIHGMSLLAAASIWITITLSGMLSISRSFMEESENGCINALLMIPHDPSVIFLGKFLSNLWRVVLSGIFAILWFTALFGLPGDFSLPIFAVVCLAGMSGIAAVGSFVASVAARCSSGRETIFMILLTPLILSMVVLSVLATASIFEGSGAAAVTGYVGMLVLLDVVYFMCSFLLFEFAVGT